MTLGTRDEKFHYIITVKNRKGKIMAVMNPYANLGQLYPMNYAYTNTPNNTGNTNQVLGVEFRYIQGGENAAKAYPVMPGSTMLLMDTETPYMYFKTVAFNGVPQPLRKFKIEEVFDVPATDIPEAKEVTPDYVTKEDFNDAINKLMAMISSKPNYNKNRGDRHGKSDLRSDE